MAENTFRMYFPKSGFLRYVVLSLIPPICYVLVVYILISSGMLQNEYLPGHSCFHGAAWIFIILFPFLSVPRNHNIEVQHDTLIERDNKGLHIRTVHANQIDHFHVNQLREIILYDIYNQKLLCIEQDMTNRNHFEAWLAGHCIKSK